MAETNTNTTVTETINKAENSGGDPVVSRCCGRYHGTYARNGVKLSRI